jgi:hypothetical protein
VQRAKTLRACLQLRRAGYRLVHKQNGDYLWLHGAGGATR